MLCVWVGGFIERTLRLDDAVGAVAVHGFSGFYGVFLVGIFAGGYPTGINNIDSSMGGQLMGILTFLPLGFLSGYFESWVLKKLNLLRVPPRSSSRPRHGRVPAGLLSGVRAHPRVRHRPRRPGARGRPILLEDYKP